MTESTPLFSHTSQGSLVQLKKRLISTSGNSIVIRKGTDANIIREMQIFPKSKIRFLLPIGEKAFFLAISSKRIALFQLMKNSPIAIFKLDGKIMDHGMVKVLTMGRKKEEEGAEFRVRLLIPLAFRSGTLRKMRITVHFGESQVVKQKMKCLEELAMDDQKLQSCVDLGNTSVFGFYEDTVVKSDGTLTRAGEPSRKKKRRIAVVARQLWHGNMLLATENGSMRVVRVKEINKENDSLSIFSEGQCIPPYCTLSCRQPSVIISTENNVILGTQRGELHCLNKRLELVRKIDTEEGPVSYLKIDENDSDFLWVGFGSGELRRIKWMSPDQNGGATDDTMMESVALKHIEDANRSDEETGSPRKRKVKKGYWKESETYMECLEKGCYFKTRKVVTFIMHIRRIHNATLALAGLVLLCQCGNESISCTHNLKCAISNFTVVRKNDYGPSRTLADMMTPKCILCEFYPKTVYGYAYHINRAHSKSLYEIGCFLKCGMCGGDFYDMKQKSLRDHPQKCKSRFYSLLKLGEEAEKKDETEMDQMVESTPLVSVTFQGSLIQLKKKLISTSGNSIVIRKGTAANIIKEIQIFPTSKIRFLLPIGDKSGENLFFLAISSKRIALSQLKKSSPIAIFKFDEKIVDHGIVKVLTMGRKKEEEGAEFRVRLVIPLAFRSGTLRKIRLTGHFLESQVIKQKMKCLEELVVEDQKLQNCVDLGNNNVFGFYEDTVVKSDGTVTRAGEPSTKKKRRVAVVARELWHGNILMATENGTIRVVRVKEMNKNSDSLSIFSEGQCIPPYCTLRCRQPSVIISTKKNVIVGTREGEVHCLNERLELVRKIDTEDGPISCLKVDENDANFLCIGFESGELRRINWMAHLYKVSTFNQQNIVKRKIFDMDVDKVEANGKGNHGDLLANTNGLEIIETENELNKEAETPLKNFKSMRTGPGKRSETEMVCLEKGCDFKTRVACTFSSHLRYRHRTNLTLAGLALRCQCGIDSLSESHSRSCSISNFTVVRTHRFGPSRTLADKKMTPQCIVCKVYPKTVYGYAKHLYEKHQMLIDQIGYYLKCGVCGGDYYTMHSSNTHSSKCKSRIYKLLKIGEEEEKKDKLDQNADALSSVSLTGR